MSKCLTNLLENTLFRLQYMQNVRLADIPRLLYITWWVYSILWLASLQFRWWVQMFPVYHLNFCYVVIFPTLKTLFSSLLFCSLSISMWRIIGLIERCTLHAMFPYSVHLCLGPEWTCCKLLFSITSLPDNGMSGSENLWICVAPRSFMATMVSPNYCQLLLCSTWLFYSVRIKWSCVLYYVIWCGSRCPLVWLAPLNLIWGRFTTLLAFTENALCDL